MENDAIASIEHPQLGRFVYQDHGKLWSSKVGVGDATIDFRLATHTGTKPPLSTERLLAQGAAHYEWAVKNADKIVARIVDELLDVYNDDWSDEEQGGIGEIDAQTFVRYLSLSSIAVRTDGRADWYYTDGGLFGGHWIEVRLGANGDVKDVGLAG
jgi:hypothetical protein